MYHGDEGDAGLQGGMVETTDRPWKISRVIPMPPNVISPSWLPIAISFVVLCFFLRWHIKHPNEEAMWLWFMSIVCELWFGFSWILDQIPINRSTNLAMLRDKFDGPTPYNRTGRSDLPSIDLFVSTADPEKQSPLVTTNTIISILAVDYSMEKLTCYILDDDGALLTFEVMRRLAASLTYGVPFYWKHDIKPKNPDSFFSIVVVSFICIHVPLEVTLSV
ncbi:hypothetical protein NE237_019492 [Protea cynaroides]|uniref:Cellulose synthase n=1 Tax=Protea cynaroides TaxID=273540 RepID=A0A9Q0JS24_9MAGN|nr:hypothetical protein NE237_019492 [Protea cynaroides]